jgi:hypothetical protein
MRTSIILFCLLCSVLAASTQVKKQQFGPEPPKVLVIPKNLFTPNKNGQLSGSQKDLINQLTRLRQSGQGSYSHSTPYGKVYSMPPSNMACLVPDVKLNAPMPGSTPSTIAPSTMPNAFKPQKLIPDNK